MGLRVLREVAEQGTLTAAAAALGYTQSAVSRQMAALERTAGVRLLERRRDGVWLTPAGRTLLTHATVALDALDAADRALHKLPLPSGAVRLGMFISAGAVVVPRALEALRRSRPDIEVTTKEGTSPALVRALRAGTLDLAVVSVRAPFRAPDAEDPPLELTALAETTLLLAVPAGAFAGRTSVRIEELASQRWIASPSRGDDPLLGVWPGVAGRPRVAHTARDWLTKLQLVAAGCGVTTVPANLLATAVPAGVRLLAVEGGPSERRQMVLARLPVPPPPAWRSSPVHCMQPPPAYWPDVEQAGQRGSGTPPTRGCAAGGCDESAVMCAACCRSADAA